MFLLCLALDFSPPHSISFYEVLWEKCVAETKERQSLRVAQKRKLVFLMSCLFLFVLLTEVF